MSVRTSRSDGERTRRAIVEAAARLASVRGLEGLSIGALAEAVGVSKSGLYAHFGSKEALQLAAIEHARRVFIGQIVAPAHQADAGLPRLEALCERFLAYVRRRVFPAGCFFVTASAEVAGRPGPLRDKTSEYQRDWLRLLEAEVRAAQELGQVPPESDPAQVAFEIQAALAAASTAAVLCDDERPLDRARVAVARALLPLT